MSRFPRKRLQLLKYGASIIAGGFYVWALILLAENDNWVGISAITTMLLAIAAFWAIWQNRLLQIRERKERLLNEIIEWAENILAIIAKYPTVHFEQLEDLLIRANGLKAKRYAILEASIFDQDLETLASDVSEALKDFVEQADKHAQGMGRKQRIPVPTNLEPTLVKLIEKAAKIKTRDIGKKVENMSKEGEDTGGNEPTLKGIEEHLKRQDKQSAKGKYLAMSSAGVAVALVGLRSWVKDFRFWVNNIMA